MSEAQSDALANEGVFQTPSHNWASADSYLKFAEANRIF
jgi:hypothetical protein